MWNRRELKARAKAAFKRNYWSCVFAALVIGAAMAAAGGGAPARADAETEIAAAQAANIAVRIGSFSFLVRLFLVYPFEVGGCRFFARNARGNASLNELVSGFRVEYLRNVLALFLRDLFIVLWAFLCVIPGIVKSYSYRLVPYILLDHPEMSATDAITLSRQMMKGSKWKAFVMDLSFIGWQLLSVLTLGLLIPFYVAPYMSAAHAELYLALRDGTTPSWY